jgi:hypothetical protein
MTRGQYFSILASIYLVGILPRWVIAITAVTYLLLAAHAGGLFE